MVLSGHSVAAQLTDTLTWAGGQQLRSKELGWLILGGIVSPLGKKGVPGGPLSTLLSLKLWLACPF